MGILAWFAANSEFVERHDACSGIAGFCSGRKKRRSDSSGYGENENDNVSITSAHGDSILHMRTGRRARLKSCLS
jgi:hypothetical protein